MRLTVTARIALLFALPVLLFALPALAQMPSIKINGESAEAVYLQKLDVDVKITGAVATTIWTMTFKNTSGRLLEGELSFPLPQGTSVSHYALDINGKMRDAVPVEKEKATLAFENTERRRIDPGLLEKVDGNTFRTRIYPINPNGTRTVRIGYEQELVWEHQADLRYHLPLAFANPIESFSLNINVIGVGTHPRLNWETDEQNSGTNEPLQFGEWKDSWTLSHQWDHFQANKSIDISIPQAPGAGAILMQQSGNHYFYVASVFPEQKKIEKPAPHHVTLLWDASLSGLQRDRKKELDLLDGYFSRLKNVEVTLVAFSNTVAGPKEFTVSDGHWQELNKELQNTIFDGGTQMGALDLGKYPGDEFLLFSDGHSNFGSNNIKLTNRPVYTITSSAGADYSYLESIAGRSGGELINLENLSISAGRDRLFYQTLHFMGVKAAEGLEESYPSLPTPVAGSLTVAGISYRPTASIVLQFGYGGKVVKEQTINLRYDRQQTSQPDLERVWAQKKIAELDTRYEENKLEIQHLGRRCGIVTRNTSLVVLENINDYITYQIEPPAELRDEYDRILKGRERGTWASRRQVTDNAESYFNELLTWWGAVRVVRIVKVEKDTVKYNAAAYALRSVEVGSNVRIRGTASKSEQAPPESTADLNEVVVVGYATQHKRDVTASVSTVSEYTIANARSGRNAGSGESAGREVSENAGTYKRKEQPGSFTALKAEVNTSYLDKLKAARPAERYALYLQLRKDNIATPLFYFHTASFFLAAGEKAIGLKILSNVAELEAENYELGKLLAYKLKELGETEAELAAFKQVLDWRPFEPQSYRDYGLALEDAGSYQQALDTLYYALTKNYDANVEALYPGIEETLLPEINNLITRRRGKIDTSRIPKNLVASLPVDIRVVLNWNRPSTDIDLWVTDPDNERCYYGHRSTAMGGRISHDFTRGLGPEQFLLKKAAKGRYKVEVNYYGDTQVKLAGETSIMVEVYTNYGTVQQKRNVITLQMEKGAKGAVYVGDFDFK